MNDNLHIPLSDLLDEKIILRGVPENTVIQSISTDSRNIKRGDWFICLKGEKFDGHEFIDTVIQAGAAGIIYDRDNLTCPGIKVPDTTEFLGKMASRWRDIVNPLVIAVTGTNGKTSVKELTAFLLGVCEPGKVCYSSGNLNNQFGVPYTLLSLKSGDKYLVVEIGTNHPGEISPLSRIARPDYSVITSVSLGHAGNFNGIEGISFEKSEIVSGMKPGGILVLNPDLLENRVITSNAENHKIKIITPGKDIILKEADDTGIHFYYSETLYHFPVCGNHQFQNLRLAVAVLREVVADARLIGEALSQLINFKPVKGRLQNLHHKIYNLWDDSYNANPASCLEAINFLMKLSRNSVHKNFAAFGMMAELGVYAEAAHENLGRQASSAGFEAVFFSSAEENNRQAFIRGWKSDQPEDNLLVAGNSDQDMYEGYKFLSEKMGPGDHLLVKGSRSTKMERILNHFK